MAYSGRHSPARIDTYVIPARIIVAQLDKDEFYTVPRLSLEKTATEDPVFARKNPQS